MNRNALLGLVIAILIPVTSYLLVKYYGERAVVMPRKYFFDDVVQDTVKGKIVNDTVWHQTANFSMVNQLGDTVDLYDIKGRIIVANFIFTHCAGICPAMTKNMRKVQTSFATYKAGRRTIDSSVVQFLSFTIDPERDSVQQLKKFADRFEANHDNWWFLRGTRTELNKVAFEEFKVDQFNDEPIDSSFIHTNKFVVLDKNYIVRGFYDGLDTVALSKMSRDIGLLMMEKDHKVKSTLFTKIIDLSWLWLIVVFLVIIFVLYINNQWKKAEVKKPIK
jgi:protein SCO1/2